MYIAGNDGTDLALAAEIRVEVDGVPGSNDMPGRILLRTTPDGSQAPVDAVKIDSAQNVTVSAGNLVIGTSGKGIDFSATPGTGTSELLADYEEGTWTPGSGTNSTVNSVSSAFYTKVGRIVNAYAYFNVTTTSASITITGLPFNCTGFGPAYVYFTGGTLLPFTGSSYVEPGAAFVNLGVGAIGTAAIMVSVSYMV
jgi:hypothetical protein